MQEQRELMNRRAYIKLALLAAGALITGPALSGCNDEGRPQTRGGDKRNSIVHRLGIQLFTVRALMQEDPLGTLTALSEIGYREIEMVGFGGSIFLDDPLYGYNPAEFKKTLDDLGLRAPSTQFSGKAENLAEIADTAKQVGVEYMVLGMASEFLSVTPDGPVVSGVADLDQIKRIADRLNQIGEIFKRSGAGFAYHNHHMEFVRVGGEVAYDVLLASTDPELVKLEMDVGWSNVAGVAGHDYLDRYPGRYIACHLKDFNPARPKGEPSARSPIPEMTQLVTPGEGTIDFAPVLAAMDRNGVMHGYVEIDLPDDPIEAARRGYEHLRSLDFQG
jgi:sugar phosphate isomerase/epimerase